MSDVPLSKRARKKQAQARETQMSQSGTRSESVGSDTIRKDHPNTSTTSSPAPELDGEFKLRDGNNPYIEVVQKKVRNLTKRKTRLETLDAQAKDDSMPALKPDQVEALSHLPQVIAIINELNELIPVFKKLDQSEIEIVAAQHRKVKDDLREAERVKDVAVKEAYARGVADGRGETKILTSFLRYASHLRERPSAVDGENSAVEQVLIGVYQGGDKGAAVAQKLSEGLSEVVSDESQFSFADVKEAVLKFDEPPKPDVIDSPSEQLNGSYVHVNHSAEHATNGNAGYQVALSETTALDNGHYAHDSLAANEDSSRPSGLNFFQQSELESDTYPSSSHGFPVQGISFLQESELGTSQPHEEYTQGETADQVDDLSQSPQLPPIQTFTESEAPPQVNLGVGSFAGAEVSETGEAGNVAAEKILHPTPSAMDTGKVEPKTDWAEEASPTTETAPVLPLKKKEEDEWTTQASRHSRHQSQARGRGAPRGGRGEGWRGEGRGGGSRGGYRGRGGGERGEMGGGPNGERRGSWRGSERGTRGRGNKSLPPTAV